MQNSRHVRANLDWKNPDDGYPIISRRYTLRRGSAVFEYKFGTSTRGDLFIFLGKNKELMRGPRFFWGFTFLAPEDVSVTSGLSEIHFLTIPALIRYLHYDYTQICTVRMRRDTEVPSFQYLFAFAFSSSGIARRLGTAWRIFKRRLCLKSMHREGCIGFREIARASKMRRPALPR